MKRQWMLASTLLLSSCAIVQTTALGGTLILKPQIQAGAFETKTTVNAYTQASINHLILKLYTDDGTEHDTGIQKSLPNAQLGNTISFSNLKVNTTYRIKAFAYLTADESQLISTTDANSYTEVTLTNDDRPTLANLKVKLINIPFNGQGTGSLQITNGGYLPSDPEGFQLFTSGVVSTLAGGNGGTANGYVNGAGTSALFFHTDGVAVDSAGNVYVADNPNHLIRKISSSGMVSTLAGGEGGTIAGYADGTGTAAKFKGPNCVAVDAAGNVYVSDGGNSLIRKITSTGVVTTLAGGSGTTTAGYLNGTGTAAMFKSPHAVAVDGSGNVYVADQSNHLVRKITSTGVVSTIAGQATTAGYANGQGTEAKFNQPFGIAVDGYGNLYVADRSNHVIRKITSSGMVSTFAGGAGGTIAGYADGIGTEAKFWIPNNVAVDRYGNVFVADEYNGLVRKITSSRNVSTIAGQATTAGYADGTGTSAIFNHPCGLAIDLSGNLYIGDWNNNLIRAIRYAY